MGKFKNKKKIKVIDIIILITFLIILVMFMYIKLINKYISPILDEYAYSETINISTFIINESIKDIISKENIDDIIITEVNNNEIISVDFNTRKINKLLYDVTDSIFEYIKYLEHNTLNKLTNYDMYLNSNGVIYNVPIGIIFNNPILSSLGPKIPIYSSLIGDVKTNIKTEVSEYGINNSLVKVYIYVEMNEEVILPFTTERVKTNKEILLGMKIINGVVPKYYGSGLTLESPLVSNYENMIK